MRAGGPEPPRFNRYHAYLIVGAILFAPVFALLRLRRACSHALYGWGSMHYCTESQAWDWLLSTGGTWEVWLRVAFGVVLFGAFVYSAFK
jgi:hypothetical protein